MFGALDQDWHPEEECRPPDADFLEQRFRNAKAMGLNTLRCHVKIPDQLYLELADRLGLIVWLDMPYCEFLAPATREALRRCSAAASPNHGHPSLDLHLDAVQRGLGHRSRRQSRRSALADRDCSTPRRRWFPAALVVDNSPCFPRNYHVKTDIEDFHWYNGFPHQNDAFAATTRAFARRAAWAWSPHGDAAEARRRAAGLLGIRRLGPAASARHPREGRRRALVVRERPRLERRRRLSARRRDPLSRRRACADLRRSRRLRRRGAGIPVPRAEIPDRDAALGARRFPATSSPNSTTCNGRRTA